MPAKCDEKQKNQKSGMKSRKQKFQNLCGQTTNKTVMTRMAVIIAE